MTNLSAEERETFINFDESGTVAIVSTCNRPLQNKLNKLLESNSDIKLIRKDENCVEYIVPKRWVKVSPPRQVNYTEEQKLAMSERLRAARSKSIVESKIDIIN